MTGRVFQECAVSVPDAEEPSSAPGLPATSPYTATWYWSLGVAPTAPTYTLTLVTAPPLAPVTKREVLM